MVKTYLFTYHTNSLVMIQDIERVLFIDSALIISVIRVGILAKIN